LFDDHLDVSEPGVRDMNKIFGWSPLRLQPRQKDALKAHWWAALRGISPIIMASSVLPQVAPSATTKQTSARTVNLTQRGAPRSLPLSEIIT
jgi:hypothetical protein